MKIHVCLVSDQTLANLIPALMKRPDKVVLVASRAMKEKGLDARLASQLLADGIPADVVDDAPDTGLDNIRRYANKLVDALNEVCPFAAITLNATGGTKLMTLGFVPAFEASGADIIYTDTAHRRIEFVGRETREPEPMTDVLDVPGYLAAQGMQVDRIDSDDDDTCRRIHQRRHLTQFIGENIEKLQGTVKMLNGSLANAIGKNPATQTEVLRQADFTLHHAPSGAGKTLFQRCVELGLIEWQAGSLNGKVIDLDAARYLSGIWLEEYAWLSVRDCQPFDVRMGVHRAGEGDDELNEFDLLAVHSNQLLFVECKTANYQNRIGQANQTAYKIDSLSRQARGLFGETWLLTAITPPHELEVRARDARFRLIGPDELPRLREIVQRWMA